MASRKRSMSVDEDMHGLYKEWDEASCPICMEHPHNAVLLLCSSYDKGCRSYICDTSYRHSNCLDRFKKLRAANQDASFPPRDDNSSASDRNLSLSASSNPIEAHLGTSQTASNSAIGAILPGASGDDDVNRMGTYMEVQGGTLQPRNTVLSQGRVSEETHAENSSEQKVDLRCPLCRGDVLGWKVVEEARKYLNLKHRSCSRESCSFSGNYRELRQHARRVHPTARPADIDPSRQRAWRRLEDQREYDDIVSAIRSAMPGAIVLGDYVIENGDRLAGERERVPSENGRWFSTFFLFQMIGSMDPIAELRSGRSRALSRHRRSTGPFSRRRFLWGENLLGLQDDDDDEEEDEDEPDLNILSDMGEDASPNPRRRRRLTRWRSDEDHP